MCIEGKKRKNLGKEVYFHRGFRLSFEMALDKVSSVLRGRLHRQAADIVFVQLHVYCVNFSWPHLWPNDSLFIIEFIYFREKSNSLDPLLFLNPKAEFIRRQNALA
jgi:hypothetical protein